MGKKMLEKVKAGVLDTWSLEIAASLLAFVSLAIIIILLSVYNGHPQFSFAGVTLNTVIAVLAACVRIGLVLPVSEALSQWKWIWYSKQPRPLTRFATIDDASRGSKGSIALLWETKGLSLTSIGAAIVLLSIATEPFIQQTVNFKPDLVYTDDNNVQIQYSQSWSGASEVHSTGPEPSYSSTGVNNLTAYIDDYGSVRDVQLGIPGQAAIQFGLNANSTHDVAQQLPVKCLSGNCTWPAFESLAVCSQCTNLDAQIQTASSIDYPMAWFFPSLGANSAKFYPPENLTSYFISNGLNLNNRMQSYYQSSYPVMLTSSANLKPSDTITFKNATTLLFSTSMLQVPPSDFPTGGTWQSPKVNISAMECGLYLCIKKYDSKVVNGSLIEDSKEIAADRDPTSFAVDPSIASDNATLSFAHGRTSPDVDALFSNTTFFVRTPLVIKLPPSSNSSNLDDKKVSIPQPAIDGLSSYILSLFDVGTFANSTAPGNETGCTLGNASIPCAGPQNVSGMAIGDSSLLDGISRNPTQFSPAVMELLYNSPNLSKLFQNIADSITNEMRRNADNQTPLTGQLGTVRTVLDVRWAWIAFPAFLVVASLAFFLLSMIESHRQNVPLWKSSILAVLYHSIEEKARSTVQLVEKASEMEREAEELNVQLRRDGGDGALMLRPDFQHPHSIELLNQDGARGGSTCSEPNTTP